MTKIVNEEDGTQFIWRVITPQQAKEIFNNVNINIFMLFTDGGERLIEDEEDLQEAIEGNYEIAIEVGKINVTITL